SWRWSTAGLRVGGSLLLPAGRLGLGTRHAREDLADRHAEAGQDRTAGEGVALGQGDARPGAGVDVDLTAARGHPPDEQAAGLEILLALLQHLAARVPLAQDLDDQLGDDVGYGLGGPHAAGEPGDRREAHVRAPDDPRQDAEQGVAGRDLPQPARADE